MGVGRKVLVATALAAAVHAPWVRPRLMHWGASDDEVTGRPSARDIQPEWQSLAVGDTLTYLTRRHGAVDAWTVAVLEPDRFLGLLGLSDLRGRRLDPDLPRPPACTEGLRGFWLKPTTDGRTGLVVGGYEAFCPRWLGSLSSFVGVVVVWIMQARMLVVLRRNAERTARRAATISDTAARRGCRSLLVQVGAGDRALVAIAA